MIQLSYQQVFPTFRPESSYFYFRPEERLTYPSKKRTLLLFAALSFAYFRLFFPQHHKNSKQATLERKINITWFFLNRKYVSCHLGQHYTRLGSHIYLTYSCLIIPAATSPTPHRYTYRHNSQRRDWDFTWPPVGTDRFCAHRFLRLPKTYIGKYQAG